jgi:hypothetical protein
MILVKATADSEAGAMPLELAEQESQLREKLSGP